MIGPIEPSFNLTEANLTRANLTEANLIGANLRGASYDPEQLADAITDDTTKPQPIHRTQAPLPHGSRHHLPLAT